MVRRYKNLWSAGLAIAAMLAAIIAGWVIFFRSTDHPVTRTIPLAPLPEGRRPADLKVALLFDCYEHALENVPPRWDTSSRQRNWRAPPPPLPLLRSSLKGTEPELLAWMEGWERGANRGMETIKGELEELEALLKKTSLPFEILFKVGLAVHFADNTPHAVCWFRAAIRRAEIEYKDEPPGDPRAQPLLDSLPQTAALWRLVDYPSLERRFALERRLYPAMSPQERRAGLLQAEMQYYQGNGSGAADLIIVVRSENRTTGDLTRSDEAEVEWLHGITLFSASRYLEAIPHLRAASSPDNEHATRALPLLGLALIRTDQLDQAEEVCLRLSRERIQSQTAQTVPVELRARREGKAAATQESAKSHLRGF